MFLKWPWSLQKTLSPITFLHFFQYTVLTSLNCRGLKKHIHIVFIVVVFVCETEDTSNDLNNVSHRLPLPGCLLTMFPDEVDPQTEDSSFHGGRIRSFKHERGNWATYVYVPCKTCTQCCSCSLLKSTSVLLWLLIWFLWSLCVLFTLDHPEEEFRELLEELLSAAGACGVGLTPQEEFHLSLSQTVVLRHHWIQPLTQSLRTGLAHCKRFFFLFIRIPGENGLLLKSICSLHHCNFITVPTHSTICRNGLCSFC